MPSLIACPALPHMSCFRGPLVKMKFKNNLQCTFLEGYGGIWLKKKSTKIPAGGNNFRMEGFGKGTYQKKRENLICLWFESKAYGNMSRWK